MAKANVYDITGVQTGDIQLSDAVFGIEPNEAAVHAVVKNHLANCRQGTQSALTRAEVSGGGRKPWRQKGTGRARQGSTRSPQWTHGGIVFAPKPRSYSYTLNKKLKRLALKSVLSDKAAKNAVYVVDGLDLDEVKTKKMVQLLTAIDAGKSVVVTDGVKQNVVLSARNIPGVVTTPATILSVYDIVNAKSLVVDKAALATIEEVFQ
ncbi:MAG: 50S ribosomal protein L4 [Clostridiales bacterium]|nr:50S ribosomal protein L4 [Clostridiales bacterium]MCD8085091.1 50S ribosomal protein L4 [Clostridiales bacterium]MCD8160456.1 50S ribosomal protein L4 [Clostridiales bacterium]